MLVAHIEPERKARTKPCGARGAQQVRDVRRHLRREAVKHDALDVELLPHGHLALERGVLLCVGARHGTAVDLDCDPSEIVQTH